MKKFVERIFFGLVCLSMLTPFWVFKDLLFPYVTSKAFYFRILIDIAVPLYAYLVIVYKEYRPRLKNPLTIAVLSFLGINIISAIVGINPLHSFLGNFERMGGVYYMAHLVALYFYLLLLGRMPGGYLKKFLYVLVIMAGVMSLYAILVRLQILTFLPDPSFPRISATLGNPIFLASYLVLPLCLTIYFACVESKVWLKWVLAGVALLDLIGIYLSGTRGAIVGLIVGLFVAAVFFVIGTPKRKVKVYGGIGVGLFIVLMAAIFAGHAHFAPGSMLHRISNLKDSNSEARLIQWKTALKGFTERPVLGVGAENYYAISNKYYDPNIYTYDRSWFDKPHNYFLEILVTSGVVGFVAFAAMLILSWWMLYRGYRAGGLSLVEAVVLGGGFLAYQIQNLFVFDTVAASLTFFIFIGFCAYIGDVASEPEVVEKKGKRVAVPVFAYAVTGILTVVMIYALYATEIVPMEISKAINYGYAYANANPDNNPPNDPTQNLTTAERYFQRAQTLPFNIDPIELASKYGDFAQRQTTDSPLSRQIIDHAIASGEDAMARIPNDAAAWERLAGVYITKAITEKNTIDPRAEEAINTSIALSPLRPEPRLVLVRVRYAQNNPTDAERILKELIQEIPTNFDARTQLAFLYHILKQDDEAVAIMEQAFKEGYTIRQAQEVIWMGDYYAAKNRIPDAIAMYEKAVAVDPNNVDIYWGLAQLYKTHGDKAKAIQIAQAIMQYDKTRAQEMQDFIKSIQ